MSLSSCDLVYSVYWDTIGDIYCTDELLPTGSYVRSRVRRTVFDKECRDAKRLTRRLCRCQSSAAAAATTSSSASAVDAAGAKAAWYSQRRRYRELRNRKSAEFCDKGRCRPFESSSAVDTVDALLGRGSANRAQQSTSTVQSLLCRQSR